MPIVTAIRKSGVRATRESANRAGSEFLLTEVDTGITFANLALATKDGEKRHRNTANAVTAYTAIVRFMDRVVFTDAEASQFRNSFGLLKDKLLQLREPI